MISLKLVVNILILKLSFLILKKALRKKLSKKLCYDEFKVFFKISLVINIFRNRNKTFIKVTYIHHKITKHVETL